MPPPPLHRAHGHSPRSAVTGSTPAARRPGNSSRGAPTAPRTAVTPRKVPGPEGHAEQERAHRAGQHNRTADTEHSPGRCETCGVPHDEAHDRCTVRADRHADADLGNPLRDRIRQTPYRPRDARSSATREKRPESWCVKRCCAVSSSSSCCAVEMLLTVTSGSTASNRAPHRRQCSGRRACRSQDHVRATPDGPSERHVDQWIGLVGCQISPARRRRSR